MSKESLTDIHMILNDNNYNQEEETSEVLVDTWINSNDTDNAGK